MISLSLRSIGALLALIGIVLALFALHSALLMFGPAWALAGTSLVTLLLAGACWLGAAIHERYKRRHTTQALKSLLSDHPIAGLGGAVLFGALSRLGFDANQMTAVLKAILPVLNKSRKSTQRKKGNTQ